MNTLKGWVAGQFTTRVIVLMPVAIAINIVLGATVQQALKLPIYLDSIGTILVGVLAGPLAGALTGILSNLIWGYLLPAPIGSTTIGPFAITAGVIGLLAGLWGQLGLFRPRHGGAVNLVGAIVAVVLVGALAFYTYARHMQARTNSAATPASTPRRSTSHASSSWSCCSRMSSSWPGRLSYEGMWAPSTRSARDSSQGSPRLWSRLRSPRLSTAV